MNVAILGLGRFGTQLTEELVSMGVEVLSVDRSPPRVNEVAETATLAAEGNIADYEFLQSLDLPSYDTVVIAVGSDIATSVLAALTLKQRMGLRHVVAKASTTDHAESLRLAGADIVVSPEQDAAISLAHVLGPSSRLSEYLSLGPSYGVAKLKARKSAVGRTLGTVDALTRHKVVLLAMIRGNEITFNPGLETQVEDGDVWLIAGDDEQLRKAGS